MRAHATPGEVAWLAVVPCAAVAVAAMVLLGRPLGAALLAPRGMAFWPSAQPAVLPEPTEHARYLLALLCPVLLAGVVLLAARRPPSIPARTLALLVGGAQALTVALLLACLWIQHRKIGPPIYDPPQRRTYFTPVTLAVACLGALALALALSRPTARERVAALLRDTPRRRRSAIAAAVALLAIWLLTAVNSDATIGATLGVVGGNLSIWIDEAAAVLNGHSPLVDLQAQYAQLWPYASGAAMALLGDSVSVFAGTMLAGTAVAMLAVFALLRRVTRSWLAALALFATFLATSFFMESGTLADRYTPAHLFSLFPLRYGGPYLLAWLTVRHLDCARPRRRALLFMVGGLVAVNNVELGLPALAATLAALAFGDPPRSWAGAGRLAADVALGLAGAVIAVLALTLATEGSLPHFRLALTFARLFGVEGFGMLPMRALGFHVVIGATFVAAIGTAAVQAAQGPEDAPLTGALAWAGVFGLGAGSYYVGRSHPEVLISLFSPWALALMLLLVAVVRSAEGQPRWRPSPAVLALFGGVGLAVCSLAQTPAPWTQIDRLGRTTPTPVLHPVDQEQAVADWTDPGEPVALLAPVGHRIADDVGIDDVVPFSDVRQIVTQEQLDDVVAALRAANGTKVVVAEWIVPDDELAALQAAGFGTAPVPPQAGLVMLVDERGRGR